MNVTAEEVRQFEWPEYVVFSVVLLMSMAIGVFYGCFQKQDSNEEYLLGGRKMHPVPVALSLLCSYVSSVTLLGHPVEIYMYGTQLSVILVCFIPLTFFLIYVMVPLYYDLQMVSVYEYLERRYNTYVRTILSVINVIYTIFYMSMVVYGPSLALSYVTDLDYRLYFAIIFFVCIFYSTLGGFKAVLWTDTLQAGIMFVSMMLVVIMGISFIDGGLDTIWQRAKATDRIQFFNVDPDPRTRHTLWTSVIGGFFTWLPMYANQAQIQRYVSLPSMRDVKIALYLNLFGLFILMGFTYLCGLVMYGQYFDCDPVGHKKISQDQLLPVFVMDTLGDYPGLPGLFVAGITCAGLSTVSSGVNALAASITEDYVKKFRPNLSEGQLSFISKLTALVTGILSFGFCFIAAKMGSIFSTATTVLGILGGPQVGLFILGQTMPWTNTEGAVTGLLASFAFMIFLGVGNTIQGNKGMLTNQRLPLSGIACPNTTSTTLPPTSTTFATSTLAPPPMHWKDKEYSGLSEFFSLSYMWYPAVGTLTAFLLGLIFSLIYRQIKGGKNLPKANSRLVYPVVMKFWLWLMPIKIHDYFYFEDDNKSKAAEVPTPIDLNELYASDPAKINGNGNSNPTFVNDS